MNKNVIAFKKKLLVVPEGYQNNRIDAATANAELMRFGYMLDEKAFEELSKADPSFIHQWITEVSEYLTDMIGDGIWKPLHAGFPETVMNMSVLEQFIHAIHHYYTNGEYYPDQEVTDAGYEYEYTEYKMIKFVSEEEFLQKTFTNLILVNNSLAPSDTKDIIWFNENYPKETLKKAMPSSVPFKENLTVLAAYGLPVPVKTPTDVLRIANFMSGNATDLKVPSKTIRKSQWGRTQIPNPAYEKYRFKLPRSKRKHLMYLLEDCAYVSEMATRLEAWKRLGEAIHPGDYAKKFPKAYEAFNLIRNRRIRTWAGKVHLAFNESYDVGIAKLSERPGEFARRLDSLVRQGPGLMHPHRVLNPFRVCAVKVSNKVLFELYEHFKGRKKQKARSVWIKGARKPTPLETLVALSSKTIDEITDTIWGTFSDKFALLEPLGAVWIDEELKNIPAPVNMSSTSEALTITIRGARTKFLSDKKVIRSYIHWTAGVDIDLSMELYSVAKKNSISCTFHNMRPCVGVYHSGDVIPHYVGQHAEYIDVHLDAVPYDYGLLVVHVFSGGRLSDHNARIGFMERDTAECNITWRPASVTNAMKSSSDTYDVALLLLDIKNKEWIWIDEDIDSNTPISHGSRVRGYVERVALPPEISAYDILKMHAEARGKIVNDPEKAETLFKYEDFKSSYEEILKYML